MTLFHDASDFRAFVALLRSVTRRFRWELHAWCLMPNHFHLVLSALRVDLSKGMHRLNGLYAQRFNDRYERTGHVFQNRFGARLIEREDYLDVVREYVLANPVRAGLADSPDAWPWGGSASPSSPSPRAEHPPAWTRGSRVAGDRS
jgi:putative transposase